MLEALFLVLVVVVLIVLVFWYNSFRDQRLAEEAQSRVASVKEQLKIAERKYMQGRIKKNVFDSLADDLEEELLSAELVLFRLKKVSGLSVDNKISLVLEKMSSKNKHKKSQIEKILKETELLREEISLLESKLLRREIKESVFEKLVKKKESALIKKETELNSLVTSSKDFD